MQIANLDKYKKLLNIRSLFNQIQQISWQSNQLAKQFPIDQLDENQRTKLLIFYLEMIPQLREILSQLEKEYEEQTGNNTNRS